MGVNDSPSTIAAWRRDGELTYRGVPVRDAIGHLPFQHVWALLVDGVAGTPLPPAETFPLPVRTGDHRVDMQIALVALAPVWGLTSILHHDAATVRSDLARASVTALSFLAQSLRGQDEPTVPDRVVNQATGTARRFLMRWHGQVGESRARALDAAWVAVAADIDCPATEVAVRTARTGADVAACLAAAFSATSGPLEAGGTILLADLLDTAPGSPAAAEVRTSLGLTPARTTTTDPRAQALEAVAAEIGLPDLDRVRAHSAELSQSAHPQIPIRQVLTLLWVTALLTHAGSSPRQLTAMVACGKVAGWSAAIATEHNQLKEI